MVKHDTKKVIHIGAKELPIGDLLSSEFEYVWRSDLLEPPIQDEPVFKSETFNRYYQDALFLIDATSPWIDLPSVLTALPANQILCDKSVKISNKCQRILDLKGTHLFDFEDPEKLADQINSGFFGSQDGYRFQPKSFTIAPNFRGEVCQIGQVFHEFKVTFKDQWQLIAYPNVAQWVGPNVQYAISVEFERMDDAVHIKAVINQFDAQTVELLRSDEKTDEQLRQEFQIKGGKSGVNIQLLIFVSGTGTFKLGQFHMRLSREPYGEFLLNGRRLVEPIGMNTDLAVYFDAGDLRPPLNVYFSGYRTAEGFEGNYMMRSLGAPFLLFTDPRLEGGAFYLGSHELQKQIISVIQETLARLHFDPSDLILSGLSMGTFGALYYGAQLSPRAIVVGKPLVNIGTIAAGTRLTRPSGFETSLDMLMFYEGDLNRVNEMNQRFWKVFKAANFKHTTFVFAYMLNDDYDPHAFPEIRDYLKEAEPTVRILSKGLVGRHNDNTDGIVDWFLMQYRHLLQQQFDRHFD
ncbi:accessory Sec system protein Asp2 [Lacticaseibacillus paracasei]|uniref:accessory Sec system protein Asp2 n=1 Tax=Lacticaseibacillus paracasei TaxID=1597 RepID=UPI001C47E8EF|nr:accessory Sec system protein Asp2 [Lacticaseibacillus paracasei]QXJ68259.1 accessory Sec system protein Asp2 [Lacticaseibacillus paracasei subsp. paracasei]